MWRALLVTRHSHSRRDWLIFVLVIPPRSVPFAVQVRISIIALITANFSVNGAAVKSDNRRGTRISHGPYTRDERGRKHPVNTPLSARAGLQFKAPREEEKRREHAEIWERNQVPSSRRKRATPFSASLLYRGGANSAWQPLPCEPESPLQVSFSENSYQRAFLLLQLSLYLSPLQSWVNKRNVRKSLDNYYPRVRIMGVWGVWPP